MTTITATSPQPKISNAVTEAIFKRRAVRNYTPQRIDRSTIDFLIDAARMAPSAMNLQPYRFVIVDDPVAIAGMSAGIQKQASPFFDLAHKAPEHNDPIFYAAPVVVFLIGDKNSDWAGLDVGLCALNMMLAAESVGLATCPVGFARIAEQTDAATDLQLHQNEKIFLAVTIGHSNETPEFHGRKTNNVMYLKP